MLFFTTVDTSAPVSARHSVPQIPRSAESIDRALLDQPAEWACFPSAWHLAAWRAEAGERLAPCVDCLPDFQARMQRLHRCRHPDVLFIEEDGEVVGRLPTPSGLSRYGAKSDVDPAASAFTVAVACRVLGVDGVVLLVGISAASLPRNRSLIGVLCPPAPTRNNPSHIHQGGAGSDQGDSDQQQVAAA